MRSEFQDVFKDAYDHWIDDACSHRYNASKSLALQVWQHQQSKVDELEHKAKLLESDHKALLVKYQATKKCWEDISKEKEELQRRNQMLNDNIKEQGQKLVYQNEVIETQAEKLLGLRDENAEMQKRVDAALAVLTEYYTGSYDESPDLVVDIEQALKGGSDASN